MGTHYKGPDKEKLALEVMIKLLRCAESFTQATKDVYTKAGLTESQFGVLEALYHLGPMSQKEIGSKILKTKGNLTMIVDNLLKNGLVLRAQQPADKRYYSIRISASGEKLIRQVFPDHVRGVVKALSALDPKEQAQLAFLCKKLGTSLK